QFVAEQAAASPVRAAVVTSRAPMQNGSPVPISESAGHFRDNMASQLKTTNWSQRIGPAAGAALVIVALVLVLLMDRVVFQGMVDASPRSAAADSAVVDLGTLATPESNGAAAAISKPGERSTVPPSGTMKEGPSTTLANVDPVPPPDVPESETK